MQLLSQFQQRNTRREQGIKVGGAKGWDENLDRLHKDLDALMVKKKCANYYGHKNNICIM